MVVGEEEKAGEGEKAEEEEGKAEEEEGKVAEEEGKVAGERGRSMDKGRGLGCRTCAVSKTGVPGLVDL